ncbi:MAG: GNAT family N-acetyltransferase [Coriobacteriia bacterium]|nr:GNAT family N-acetyltransferase [Coriobacteriia bacterium]
MEVRSLESSDREWSDALVAQHFGSSRVVSRGRLHDATTLPGLIALKDGVPIGLLLYRIEADECELVVLVSERPREGIATALVDALVNRLCESGCTRAWLVTTNDNLGAQSFYESLGWRLAAVHRAAVTQARELKPEIPAFGENGVPIEDELEYELDVSRITRAST